MSTGTPSPTIWIRWLRPYADQAAGDVERLPRVVGLVFVARGDAEEIEESDVPVVVRRGRTG